MGSYRLRKLMPSFRLDPPAVPILNRKLVIASAVLLFHAAALWGLQSGLLRRAVEIVVPVALLSEVLVPPTPVPPAPEPQPPIPVIKPPEPVQPVQPRPVVRKPVPPPAPAPMPLALPPQPAPAEAPATAAAPSPFTIGPFVQTPPAVAVAPAPPAPAPPAPAPPASAQVDLPSSNADYLQNPKPVYPPISKRLGEQGKVMVGVLIGVDGSAQQAEIRQSSGFERLDQAALATVLKWRYLPGKRGGVAEAMWFSVPINFVLE